MADKTTPAFPVHEQHMATGLAIRDYFAAKALPFVMRFYSEEARGDKFVPDLDFDLATDAQEIAYEAYRMADAMLRAREGV